MSDGQYINDQSNQERQDVINSTGSKWIVPLVAGLGTIGLGAYMLRRRLMEGGNLTNSLFDFLGLARGVSLEGLDRAANAGASAARSGTAGIKSIETTSYDLIKKQVNIGPVDIIDDLKSSIDIMGRVDGDIAQHIAEKTTEYTQRALANNANSSGFFTQGLHRVTMGQILDNADIWKNVLGTEQVSVLQNAFSKNLITRANILDNKLFFNSTTNEVLDLRLRNIFSKVRTENGVVSRVGRFDMFGQADVFSTLLGPRRNIAVLGPGDAYAGNRMFIDGTVYGYARDTAGSINPIVLGQNRYLGVVGDQFHPIVASRQGQLAFNVPQRTGFFGKMLSAFENATGVGPSFATRPSFAERWIINPYKRARALQNGSGEIFVHPFRREFELSRVMDAAIGGEMPELARRGGAIVPVPGGGHPIGLENLSGAKYGLLPNRVGILFDVVDNHSVVRASSLHDYQMGLKSNLYGRDMVVPPKKGGFVIRDTTIKNTSSLIGSSDVLPGDLTALGFRSKTNRFAYYDVAPMRGGRVLTKLNDFANYMIYRINNLASESMLGIGFAPSHKLHVNLARLGAIPLLYEAGKQAFQYGDYLTEKFTGISPTKMVASLYAGARLAQQKFREVTGIRLATDALDKYFPGSINSDGSTIARSILAPAWAANAFMSGGSVLGGAIAAAATYFAIGGPKPNETASDLYREYTGDKKVAVRKGQMWGLGYLPFFGGRVDHYDYNWYAKLTSDYKTKSIYGSQSEYWSYHANVFGIPFPTPSNLFGVLNVLNPYRLESMHHDDRPYTQTESNLINFPIIGPVLARTVGQLLKPTVYRQPDRLPLLAAGLADRGLTPGAAKQMGIPSMNATSYEAEDPTTILNTIARQANIATEPLGVYKFAMEFFGVKLEPKLGTRFATSNTIDDPGKAIYDSVLGGALGQTEFIRRFFLSDYSSAYRRAAEVNPIKNNMPAWLPGMYSTSKRDANYFIDFTQGDAYSKIIDGDARLPGAGYESLNDLHSGISGNYDDVDRFLILSDVAPYSSAYKQYERKVLKMDLDERWNTKVQEAIQQRQEVIGVDTRYKRYEEDIINLNMGTIAQSTYAPIRKAYDFLTHDVLAEIPYVGSKFFPFRSPLEQYRKMYVEGSEFASWDNPWSDIVRPGLYDMATEDPFTAAGKGAVLGGLMSGPMRWFTPLKSIVGSAGGDMINMAAVKGGAAIGAGLSAIRILGGNSQNMIPGFRQNEVDTIGYMDKLNYVRNRMFEELGGGFAAAQGVNKTMIGAANAVMYRSALPTSADRRYYDYFVGQQDSENRAQILQGMPSYMAEGLDRAWGAGYSSREQSDAIALDFVNNNQIPDSDWLGWNPEVSNSAVRLRLIEHGVNGVSSNIHRFGFYESHEVDMQTRLSALYNQSITFEQSPNYATFDNFIRDRAQQIAPGNARIRRMGTPFGSRREVTISQDRTDQTRDYVKGHFR